MAIYDTEDKKQRPIKRPLNLHMANHERFFKLRDLHRKRTGKPAMVAEDFLVDLMDMYEASLKKSTNAAT